MPVGNAAYATGAITIKNEDNTADVTDAVAKTVTELKVTGIDNFANLFNIWGRIKVNVTPADLKDISINIEKDVAGTAFTVTFKKAGGQFLPTASIPALAAGGKPSKKRLTLKK